MNIKYLFLLFLSSFSSNNLVNAQNESYTQRIKLREEIYTNYCHDSTLR